MEVGISALTKGSAVLRAQNLQRNKILPPIGFEALESSRCWIENCVWYVLSSHVVMTWLTYQALLKPQLSGYEEAHVVAGPGTL